MSNDRVSPRETAVRRSKKAQRAIITARTRLQAALIEQLAAYAAFLREMQNEFGDNLGKETENISFAALCFAAELRSPSGLKLRYRDPPLTVAAAIDEFLADINKPVVDEEPAT